MGLLFSLLKAWWPQIAAFVGAVALGFGMAWQLQGLRLDALEIEFSRYRNEVEQNALTAKREALEKEKFWQGAIENARINAQYRETQLRQDFVAVQSAGARLRDALATVRAQLADAPGYACLDAATSLGKLLETCRGRYEDLGSKAQGHVIDVQKMREAWPK